MKFSSRRKGSEERGMTAMFCCSSHLMIACAGDIWFWKATYLRSG